MMLSLKLLGAKSSLASALLSRNCSMSAGQIHPALQVQILSSLRGASYDSTRFANGDIGMRAYHVNPYNGQEEKESDRENQRKGNQHGLKTEESDYSTTIMERARARLQASAEQRRERGRKSN
jgi:hypothetical protein